MPHLLLPWQIPGSPGRVPDLPDYLPMLPKTYKMNGITLVTNTMANWVIRSTDMYLSLIYDRMHELIYDSKVIHADETPVKVMRIDNAKIKNGKKTYMWVYRNQSLKGPSLRRLMT